LVMTKSETRHSAQSLVIRELGGDELARDQGVATCA